MLITVQTGPGDHGQGTKGARGMPLGDTGGHGLAGMSKDNQEFYN